jgi:hypothetical protein
MAYVYLLDMTEYVEQRIAEASQELANIDGSPSSRRFLEGRSSALLDFQDFLVQNYIPKLPRRIREAYLKKSHG